MTEPTTAAVVDKVRRDFLDELIVIGVVQTPMSYDEIKAAAEHFEAHYRAAARPALDVERLTEYVAITISRQPNGLGISYNEARAIGREVAARLEQDR